MLRHRYPPPGHGRLAAANRGATVGLIDVAPMEIARFADGMAASASVVSKNHPLPPWRMIAATLRLRHSTTVRASLGSRTRLSRAGFGSKPP